MLAHYPGKGARTRPTLAESRSRAWLLPLLRPLAPAYARLGLGFQGLEVRSLPELLSAITAFQEGRSRLILAFRHAYGDEPQLLSWALDSRLPGLAREAGKPLKKKPHAAFIHGYEVPLWSGPLVRFLLPRTGALPVHHSRLDQAGLRRIREALRDGPHPLALAPEGQVSYRSRSLPRIEEGAARLGFWCAQELEAQGRPEAVQILPLGIYYRYEPRDLAKLSALLAEVEADCGLAARGESGLAGIVERSEVLADALLAKAEAWYQGMHGFRPSKGAASRRERLVALLEAALGVAEACLGLHPEGDMINRVYRIRASAWERIYPPGALPGKARGRRRDLARALADRAAGEAFFAMSHMELVDLAWYLGAEPLGPQAPFDLVVERVYDLADLASRLGGGKFTDRPNRIRKTAILTAAPALELRSELGHWRQDKRAACESVTARLGQAFITTLKEHNHG